VSTESGFLHLPTVLLPLTARLCNANYALAARGENLEGETLELTGLVAELRGWTEDLEERVRNASSRCRRPE
jgi:hypothetical protein